MNRNLKILLLALFALPLFTACHDETEEIDYCNTDCKNR